MTVAAPTSGRVKRANWRAIVLWAILGTGIGTGLCLADLQATEPTLGGLVAAVPGTPLDAQQRADGLTNSAAAGGHDGSQFYAIAHGPFDFDTLAGQLDRPRYRLQRILYPTVAWALHPGGGGSALVWTMFGVLVAGSLIGAVGTGLLSQTLRGPAWPAAVFGAAFGSIISLRICTADQMGLGLAILAIALSLRRHPVAAVAVAVAAVLTREPSLFLLIGFAAWRRDRAGALLVVVPGAVAAAWWLYLATQVSGSLGVSEFVVPFTGVKDSIVFWYQSVSPATQDSPAASEGPLGLLSALLGIGLGATALAKTGPRHPLWLPMCLSVVLLAFYSVNVLAPERNAARVFLPIQVLAVVALVTQNADRRLLGPSEPRPTSPS